MSQEINENLDEKIRKIRSINLKKYETNSLRPAHRIHNEEETIY